MKPKSIPHGDYILKDGSGWFETKEGMVVWIRTRKDNGKLRLDVYRHSREDAEPLAILEI